MTIFNATLQDVLDFHGRTTEWEEACSAGKFFTVATRLLGGGYAIGSTGEDHKPLPDLYPTLADANRENQELINSYLDDIRNGDREEGDEWDGEVLELNWSGSTQVVELAIDGDVLHEGDWREMAGIL
ncbi:MULTISPECIES: hypothetical protein [Vibrio]|uniref:hypothetical protein n=1 Tax=Vibrio TaxID=662 RepID=UPI002074E291|nr:MULTISPECIES: hypothetical protein [Vibrio]USD35456.1 hypothetical protein J8Z27_22820 [Vibrio sp. SCSIO 43186]USD72580.1 hypothetical protein J4N41_22825 [Vibrio sp. SCSIO 43139]USD98973.1 hypothetical protein CTT30_23145 [Vibrio coralliilyticus]